MIAVDTSALMAIVLGETVADLCIAVLASEPDVVMSAGTMAEALIVAGRRNVGPEVAGLIGGLGITVVPVTEAVSRKVAEAYETWGKGRHPAGLNFGDCFAYEAARSHACPLLYVGNDFSRTDVESALVAPPRA